MKPTEKSPPDLAEIGRLAVQEYLADRAYVDYITNRNPPSCGELKANLAVDLHTAKLKAKLKMEDAILNHLAALP